MLDYLNGNWNVYDGHMIIALSPLIPDLKMKVQKLGKQQEVDEEVRRILQRYDKRSRNCILDFKTSQEQIENKANSEELNLVSCKKNFKSTWMIESCSI